VVRIGESAVVKSSCYGGEPIIPAGGVSPQVLSEDDQGIPRLAFQFQVLENHVERGTIRLVKGEYVGWVGGVSWHVSSMAVSAGTVHGDAPGVSRDEKAAIS
jgi:hypothetical protein